MTRLTEPIDDTHAACLQARDDIRARVVDMKMRVAVWEPRPMPRLWQPKVRLAL